MMEANAIVNLALGQMQSAQGDPAANLEKIGRLARQAAEQGADLLCLPELCYPGYFLSAADARRLAEPNDGPFFRALSQLAREYRLHLLAGYAELGGKEDGAPVYNSCLLLDDRGERIGNVRKVYLWGKEKESFAPGGHFPVFDTRLGRIGVLNCYDVEFPEAGRILGLKGAQLVLVPAAFTNTAALRWEIELTAQALFNLYFVAGANQVNPYCCGSSLLAGPDGIIRAKAPSDQEELLLCPADLSELALIRQQVPYYSDFRPENFSMDAVKRD